MLCDCYGTAEEAGISRPLGSLNSHPCLIGNLWANKRLCLKEKIVFPRITLVVALCPPLTHTHILTHMYTCTRITYTHILTHMYTYSHMYTYHKHTHS